MFGGISFNCGDRYKLIKLVGTGAYGSVVLAYDLLNKNHKVWFYCYIKLGSNQKIKFNRRCYWCKKNFKRNKNIKINESS